MQVFRVHSKLCLAVGTNLGWDTQLTVPMGDVFLPKVHPVGSVTKPENVSTLLLERRQQEYGCQFNAAGVRLPDIAHQRVSHGRVCTIAPNNQICVRLNGLLCGPLEPSYKKRNKLHVVS